MSKKGKNTFVSLLSLLGVNYTESFSDKYYNEHPHKYNLYGISKMLSDYKIRNAATRIDDKEKNLFNIELPFVAHAGGDFVVVNGLTTNLLKENGGSPAFEELEGAVHFIRNGKQISIPVSQFIQSWSGVILLTETSLDSIEPDYKAHRKKDLFILAQQAIVAVAGIFILGIAYINNIYLSHISPISPYSVLGITLLIFVNLIGIYICYLLVLKQMQIHSRYADKICTLFSKSDCNNVLESDAAKLWDVFGWSEIGLGYFVANVFVLLFLPHLITYAGIINILSLPFTVWSVWYQKVKARQWCPLCLIVLVLLWSYFLLNCLFGYLQIPTYSISEILLTGCIFTISILALNLLIPKLSEGNQVESLRQEINSIKANDEVFKSLLLQQSFYEVNKMDSQILFGNLDAKLVITILTNPFCNPCAKMHTRIDKLINRRGESNSPTKKTNVCIQYIFSSFNESLEYANRNFIAIYLEKGKDAAWQLYSAWFEKGKSLKEAFFDDLKLDMTNPAIEAEFQKHEAWKKKTQLRATPTILVNGYKLPENYKIEDLQNFTEFNFEVK